jgi:hypothetical protein
MQLLELNYELQAYVFIVHYHSLETTSRVVCLQVHHSIMRVRSWTIILNSKGCANLATIRSLT